MANAASEAGFPREETSGVWPQLPPELRRVGPYQLCFEVASGGMATVYLAKAKGPAGVDRVAAVKVIHPHLAKETEFVEMFCDEARLASRIRHPNVCGVTDFGESDGTYFLSMDYLMGESLGRVQRAIARRMPKARAASLPVFAAKAMAQAAEGLHAAHELRAPDGSLLNVVHRDVSPHNIFVTYDGNVRVVDFGIARAEGRLHHTATGTVKGKFAYMAPEQMRGADVDRRADVWSLGVVLWETVALKRLFRRGTDSETILAVVQQPVPSLKDVRAGVPDALCRIVAKALERDPEKRYQTARALGQDLEDFVASTGVRMGAAEQSSLMHELFPKGVARKQQLVQLALQAGAESVPQVHHDNADEGSGSLSIPAGVSMVKAIDRPGRTVKPWAAAALTLGVVMGVVAALAAPIAEEPSKPMATAAEPSVITPAPEAASVKMPDPQPTAHALSDSQPVAVEEPSPEDTVSTARVAPRRARPSLRKSRPSSARANLRPVGKGTVNLVTVGGWSEVFFRGKRIGQTPGQFQLPAGQHTLLVKAFGEGPGQRVRVSVQADKTSRVRVELRD